jgi:glycosyltransferase involved in cell wall biosynthesis
MLMEAIADQILTTDNNFPEVSIIMPCLNEADTLAACIGKARKALNEPKIAGEIIVADNGSTDGNPAIATKLGARLINVRRCTAWNQLGSHVIFNTSPLNY